MLSDGRRNDEAAAVTVLVVDDEQMIRWSVEQTLSAAGFAVQGAGTGAEAMALVRALRPHVLFLDVRLPDADGLSLIERVKDESPDTAVIIMTAFSDDYSADDARRLGAKNFLSKPFNFDELPALVGQALDRPALS